MKLVYIAGKYRAYKKDGGFDVSGIYDNIYKARIVAQKYWLKGYAVICPHMNTAFLDCDVPDDTWLNGDLVMIEKCDTIVMMKGWEESKGATAELEFAKQKGLEVIYD